MQSSLASRLWRTSKAAGRPFPVLDEDDVIDQMIVEAVALKVSREDKKLEEKEKTKKWKSDKDGLDRLRQIAG